MIRSGRSSTVVEHLTPSGIPVRLVEEMWWAVATVPAGGIAVSYRRPRFVETREARITVHDYTWTMRGVALASLLVSVFARRFIR
jgi:hypothetical protein